MQPAVAAPVSKHGSQEANSVTEQDATLTGKQERAGAESGACPSKVTEEDNVNESTVVAAASEACEEGAKASIEKCATAMVSKRRVQSASQDCPAAAGVVEPSTEVACQQEASAVQSAFPQLNGNGWIIFPTVLWTYQDPSTFEMGNAPNNNTYFFFPQQLPAMAPCWNETSVDAASPSACADEKEEVSTACSESHTDLSDVGAEKDSRPYPLFSCRETSALAGMSDVVEFMRTAAVARYPARARLFELVQEASADALGQHFRRLALVGSTALRIDTPESDLDVVAFTQSASNADSKELSPPPCPADALRWIAQALLARDASLRLQLVDCSRVPVLTAVSSDGELSLDITVDQPLGESHVLWFQRLWHKEASVAPVPVLPEPYADPDAEGWEQSLEALTLRCVKWWLRRRRIPVSKEGGYPTVVWTLMVLHVLDTLPPVSDAASKEDTSRALLAALAAFFEFFCECRCSGQLMFSSGTNSMRSDFRPRAHGEDRGSSEGQLPFGDLSVLDPTTSQASACELATPLSSATRLLHAYELQRAQRLATSALSAPSEEALPCAEVVAPLPCGEVVPPSPASGGYALRSLFADAGEAANLLPSFLPAQAVAVLVLRDGVLQTGILQQVTAKPGWVAPFLYRKDSHSSIVLELCHVDLFSGALTARPGLEQWFSAADFVCMAGIEVDDSVKCRRGRTTYGCHWKLQADSLERWRSMRDLLWTSRKSSSQQDSVGGKHGQTSSRASWKRRA